MSQQATQILIFERTMRVLKAIDSTPIASTTKLHEKVFPDLSRRTVQRYLKGLEHAGYIRRKGVFSDESRFFLTEKSKQLFGELA